MVIKKLLVHMATHSFPVPSNMISIFLVILSKKNNKTRSQTLSNIFKCLQGHADEAPLAVIKIQHQRWSAKHLINIRD